MREGEILCQVEIPPPPVHGAGVYLKLSRRKAFDFPIVGVAVVMGLDETDGLCKDVHIVLGGASPNPIRASQAEEVLSGKEMGEERIREASQLALKAVRPLSNVGDLAWYRRRVIPVLVGRAIRQVIEVARSN